MIPTMTTETNPLHWIPFFGNWNIEGQQLTFAGDKSSFALALANRVVKDGSISVDITIMQDEEAEESEGEDVQAPPADLTNQDAQTEPVKLESIGHIVLAWNPQARFFTSTGLGGQGAFCTAQSWSVAGGWFTFKWEGQARNIDTNHPYHVKATIVGQSLRVWVDEVEMLAHQFSGPITGLQVGVMAQGESRIRFENFVAESSKPVGFVAMAFEPAFEGLYRDVLRPVADTEGVNLLRADEIPGPGFIIQDIVRNLYDATVIVAEITPDPANPNVYFELGYAYAMGKPIILLAKRGHSLPFDVAGMRVIFYDDSIEGKGKVESEFRRHLRAILTR